MTSSLMLPFSLERSRADEGRGKRTRTKKTIKNKKGPFIFCMALPMSKRSPTKLRDYYKLFFARKQKEEEGSEG